MLQADQKLRTDLSVQVQQIESEQMDPDSDILRSNILAFPP